MRPTTTICLLALIGAFGVQAQVEHERRLFGAMPSSKPVRQLRLPPISNSELMVAAAVYDASHPGPSKFGEAIEMPAGLEDGEWSENKERGVREWKLQISSPGAITLSLLFDDFYIPKNGEFYESKGAFTFENNHEDHKFAVAPIRGDLLTLVYTEPVAEAASTARIRVYKVVHGFNKNLLTHGASGSCNVDVMCGLSVDKHPEVAAVGMILTDDHQRYCSGVLVNNVRGDGKQYFLTANHCVFSDVSYFIIGFNYLYNECFPKNQRGAKGRLSEPAVKMAQGLRLVASWDRTDFALLEIKERIPDAYNVYLAGFDLSATPATNSHCLHHPSGDVMKVSIYRGTLLPASWSEAPEAFHWQVPAWTHGVTERGSSGSPLFTEDGLIIGHLRGGQSSCEYPKGYDLFGGIRFDWDRPERASDRLSGYLNPDSVSDVKTLRGARLSDLRRKRSF